MGNKTSANRVKEIASDKEIVSVKETVRSDKMSANSSCPPQFTERSLSYEIDQESYLHRLPDEILVMILCHVPAMDLIQNGRLVCKYWLDLVDSSRLWRKLCCLNGVQYPKDTGANSWNLDFRTIFLKRPFHRNLVKNWNAADGLLHWNVQENGGDGFAVEPNNCYYSNPVSSIGVSDCTDCWSTSYGWCEKEQAIDLLNEGCTSDILDQLKPTIEISEWTAARFDCGSQYFLHVTLESSAKKVLDNFKSERFVDQWEDRDWIRVSHRFCNYPSGVRFVRVVHGGKDRQFWKGHYGPKITATSVMLNLDNSQPCEQLGVI